MASLLWARQARERSWWTNPWAVNRPSKPLDDAVFQVEVDDVLVHRAGVVEDDRPDRRLPPPFPGLLVALAGGRSVSIVSAQVGSAPWRWSRAGNSKRSMGLSQSSPSRQRLQGVGVHHLQGARDGGAEMVLAEGQPVLRGLEPVLEPLDLGLQVFLALAGLLPAPPRRPAGCRRPGWCLRAPRRARRCRGGGCPA